MAQSMTVYLVGAGPGDPGLLTVRGAELISRADVVVHDHLVDRSILNLAPKSAELIDVGKRPGDDAARRQGDINDLLIELGRRTRTVVRLKGGDPYLFGRGGEEAQALCDSGVDWEVVPGVTSAFAVPACSGVPVTHRGLATSVTVVTGHVGDPTAPGGVDWKSLADAGGTLVILMGMNRRKEIASELLSSGRSPDTPVLVTQWGSTSLERRVRTTLEHLGEVGLESPAVIVVGPVAGMDLRSPDRPLTGESVVVTRAAHQSASLVQALRDAGAGVVSLPMIEISDPPDGGASLRSAASKIDEYSWVVFTSANAVHRFVPLLADGRSFAGVKLAVVGKATEEALAGYNLVADIVPDRPSAERLVDAMPIAPQVDIGLEGGVDRGSCAYGNRVEDSRIVTTRVLFPKAQGALRTLSVGLLRKGWEVDEVVAYVTTPTQSVSSREASAAREAGWIVFTSPSTVENYLNACDVSGEPLAVPPLVACAGSTTALAVRERGLDVAVEAGSSSAQSIVSGILEYRCRR